MSTHSGQLMERASKALRESLRARGQALFRILAGRRSYRPSTGRGGGRQEEKQAALIRAADDYASRGLSDQAIAFCERVLAFEPDHPGARERLETLCLARDNQVVHERVRHRHAGSAPSSRASNGPTGWRAAAPDGERADGAEAVRREAGTDATPGRRGDEPLPESYLPQLAAMPLFESLDGPALRAAARACQIVALREGATLFRQGERADRLYVVLEGAVVPVAEESAGSAKRLAVLPEGSFFGETGLLANQPRNASVEAMIDSRLLALDRALVWKLARESAGFFKVLRHALRDRLLDRLARTNPFFEPFDRAEQDAIARKFQFSEVRGGTVVLEQGRPSPGLFVLLSGRLRVIYMAGDGDQELATLEAGDLFGEMSLTSGRDTVAAVLADSRCWVLCLPAHAFREIVSRRPEARVFLAQLAARRSQRNRATLKRMGAMPPTSLA